jgi:CDP-diacylglycerol pyrophosphatase
VRIAGGAGLLLLLLLLLVAPAPAWASNPHALWEIVHRRCVPDEQRHHNPGLCAAVDLAGGFAVLKDIVGAEQFLLIPTARIRGIGRALPREDVSLAINSAFGRSQDQLHIHVDCISPQAHDALASQLPAIGGGWTELRTPLAGHPYRALRIPGERLGSVNPFRLLAASLDDPAAEMGRHTLVLVGARFPEPGFVLLDGRLDLLHLDRASGEELQDHSCAIVRGVSSARPGAANAIIR